MTRSMIGVKDEPIEPDDLALEGLNDLSPQ